MELNLETAWAYIVQASIFLASVGAINWGLVGWFEFNAVEFIINALPFVGELTQLGIYTLVMLGGILGLISFFDLDGEY